MNRQAHRHTGKWKNEYLFTLKIVMPVILYIVIPRSDSDEESRTATVIRFLAPLEMTPQT